MAKPKLIYALAKVIIAAAWADGEIAHDEINSLKDLLFRLPNLEARDWATLEIYTDSPIDADERARLVEELITAMATRADKKLALEALDDLIHADGDIPEDEEKVAQEIKTAIENANTSAIGGLGRLISGSLRRRSAVIANAPNREEDLDDFVRNRVYYGVRRRLGEAENVPDLPESELRKLSLAGALMARVAHVDREVTEGELGAMVDALQRHWQVTEEEANIVAEVAISVVGANMDFYRSAREFFSATDAQERVRFLDVLFAVADGDGKVSTPETEFIRSIANNLKLTHRQFIDAKIKIPRERRSS